VFANSQVTLIRKWKVFAVSGGVVQVDGKTIRFISDEVDAPNELSEAEAEAAQKRAQELMANATTHIQLHEAKNLLSHSSARLQYPHRRIS
jgi:F0F1-type ATP synthase epsilon subunit